MAIVNDGPFATIEEVIAAWYYEWDREDPTPENIEEELWQWVEDIDEETDHGDFVAMAGILEALLSAHVLDFDRIAKMVIWSDNDEIDSSVGE